jgi:predicted TIM-barrel fold metal-dependent hydrolase
MDTVSYRDLAVEEFDTTTALAHASEQAIQRCYEDFLIVDVDGHHYETASFAQIAEFIEDPVMRDQAKYQGYGGGGITQGAGGYQELGGRLTRYTRRRHEKTPTGVHRDLSVTRRWMDAIGIDILMLFPTPMLGLGFTPRVEVEVALARAYNRWLCEVVLAEEPRIKSSLYLPMNDPEAAYKIVQDFGGRKGVVGFTVCTARHKQLYDNSYMKLYADIEARGLPLVFHSSLGAGDQSLSLCNRFIAAHALGFSWWNILHCTNWLVNGLPERFPKLRTVWVESGLAWIPFLMQRLDNEWMMRSSEVPMLKKRPSDYMREMYFSTQPMEMVNNREALELTFKMINAETQLMYSSDYPHWDTDLPSTIYDLPFLSEQAKRSILGGNARRVFDLEPVISEVKQRRLAARGVAE